MHYLSDIRPEPRPWQKKRALKFALKESGSFKACFELYRCLNPRKALNRALKMIFELFFHDFWSTMFLVAAWVQVEFRSLSSFRRCVLFDWLLLLLLLSKFTFWRDCVQGWWVRSSKVCFSAMADCISAKSRFKPSFKMLQKLSTQALNVDFSSFMKSFKLQFYDVFLSRPTWASQRSDIFLISDLRSDIFLISDLRERYQTCDGSSFEFVRTNYVQHQIALY